MSSRDPRSVVLADVATFASGRTPSRSRQSDYFDGGTVPWVKTLDLNNGAIATTDESVTPHALADTGMAALPPGTVLVAMYGGFNQIGRTGVLHVNAVTNQAITAVRPNPRSLDSDYLLHLLNYKVGYWRTVASSSRKDPNITKDDVRQFPMTLPSVTVQRRIADSLNDADSMISTLERLIAKKQAVKQGMMQQLLTGRTRLTGFTEPWVTSRLADVTFRIGSGITPRGGSAVYTNTGRPFVRSQNVGWGELRLDDLAFINEATHSTFLATEIRVGDILLNITGASIGRAAVATRDLDGGNVNQHVCEIRVDPNRMNPHFVTAVLNSRIGQSQIDAYQAGGNRQGLNFKQVGSILIPSISLPEQDMIAGVLVDADGELRALGFRLAKARDIKQGIMQQLLTGRTRLPVEAAS